MHMKMLPTTYNVHTMCPYITFQVVIVGNGAVGKSSMIQRYCKGVFTKGYKKTIGVDFLEKQLRFGHYSIVEKNFAKLYCLSWAYLMLFYVSY